MLIASLCLYSCFGRKGTLPLIKTENSDTGISVSAVDTTDRDTIDPENFCTKEILYTQCIRQQGITVTELPPKQHNAFVFDSLNLSIEFLKPFTLYVTYLNTQKKVLLYRYWPDTSDNGPNWELLRIRQIKTSKRTYFNIELSSPWGGHREFCDELILDVSIPGRIEIYAPSESLYSLQNFGDFDYDSYLDFVQLNERLKRIQLYSLKKGRIKLNQSVYLDLEEIGIPYSYFTPYKVIENQRNIEFWKK